MSKHQNRRRHRRQEPAPQLGATIADRLQPGALSILTAITAPPQMTRMPSPSRASREVLNLLTAATGLVLAARPDTQVELLPGTPTTVLITSNGKAQAAFMLPVEPCEVLRALGRQEPRNTNADILQLWEENRQAQMATPDLMLITAEETWLNGGDYDC